jgi:hypothetical protein
MQLRAAIDNPPLLRKYLVCLRTSALIPEAFRPSAIAQPLRSGLRNMMAAWDKDEFVLDPSRITLSIGRTGYDRDTCKRDQLMGPSGLSVCRALTASPTEANRWSSPIRRSRPLRAKPARTVLLVLAIAKDTPLRSSRSSIWRSACDPV